MAPRIETDRYSTSYGPLQHRGSNSRRKRPLPDLEPKTNLWRYFAEPLRLRVLADRWRTYTPVAVILLTVIQSFDLWEKGKKRDYIKDFYIWGSRLRTQIQKHSQTRHHLTNASIDQRGAWTAVQRLAVTKSWLTVRTPGPPSLTKNRR